MIFQKILIKENDIVYIVNTLEKLLGVKFVIHESSYWGIYYVNDKVNGIKNIKITNNYVDEDWQEGHFKDCPFIIELNIVQEGEKILDRIIQKFDKVISAVFISDVESDYCKEYSYVNGEKFLLSTEFKSGIKS